MFNRCKESSNKRGIYQASQKRSPTIREVVRVTGLMSGSYQGIKYGPLHFRDLERCNSRAVKESKGSYDCTMKLDGLALCDVQWWIDNTDLSANEIYQDAHHSQ